jgi:hypothetical protein
MSDLVQRLANGTHPLVYSRASTASDLEDAIENGYVLLKFTETRGGTELGVPLDAGACDLREADFEAARGKVHLEGDFRLDYVPVRMIADVELSTLRGEGYLRILERADPK